jgi:GTPase Era involved in 16S rRNA processing
VLTIVDAVKTVDRDTKLFIKGLHSWKQSRVEKVGSAPPIILVLNKSDLATPENFGEKQTVPLVDRFRFHFQELDDVFDKVFTISALEGDNVLQLQDYLVSRAKPGEWSFGPDVVRTRPMIDDRLIQFVRHASSC